MSPTLLEAAMVIVLIIVAWQLGLALAPIVLRELRALRQSLDDVSDDSLASPAAPTEPSASPPHKESSHESQ
jgi:hypothetical protein